MRIAQISDTHIGLTTPGQLKKMFRELAKEEFDLLIHCGDYGGTLQGDKCVKRTIELMRSFFPKKPILSTIGNHDYWSKPSHKNDKFSKVSLRSFNKNLDNIVKLFRDAQIHFLDEDGSYVHEDYPELVFLGACGWYTNSNPPTNDHLWLPVGIEGSTNNWLLRRAEDSLRNAFEQLEYNKTWKKMIFISHFPVINTDKDYKGAFEDFSWRESIGRFLQEQYGCQHFLCGHAHQKHTGPLRYECGPDYQKPTYQIIEV